MGLIAGLGARLPGATGRVCGRFARVVVPKVLVRVVLGSTGLGLLAAPAAHAVPLSPGAGAQAATTATATHLVTASTWTAGEVPSPTWPVSPSPAKPSNPSNPSSTPTRLPAPAPPTSPAPAHPPRQPATAPRSGSPVHRGDSLWLLAAHRLGPRSDDGDIANYWPQIYAANRSVIGDDPSVIHPGQVLDLPTPTQESS